MNLYAIIMAGGVGSRFWPRSREKTPKQLLNIFGDDSIIQATVKRISLMVEPSKIVIVTNVFQKEAMMKQLPEIPEKNFLTEPFGRNTAAAIGIASLFISRMDSEAVTMVLPADHLITQEQKFVNNMKQAAEFAYQNKCLVTVGIRPTRPETGYGYVQYREEAAAENVYPVRSFAEKPDLETAQRFLESGDFLWNSGMFIWRVDTILAEMHTHMPELHFGLEKIAEKSGTGEYEKRLTEIYTSLKSISIDYGIMEKSRKVFLVKSEFTWSDIGSWEEVYQLTGKDETGTAAEGSYYLEDSLNNYIYAPGKFTALIGVENTIVIDTGDALMVCRRDLAQNVKKVVDHLKSVNTDLI